MNYVNSFRLPGLTQTVSGTYFAFMLGFFVIPNAVDQYKFFTYAVFIPALLLLPRIVRSLRGDRLLLAIVTYLLWMLGSSFWSDTFSAAEFFNTLKPGAMLLVFMLLTAYIASLNPVRFARGTMAVAVVAAIAAIISIPLWYTEHPFPGSRLVGLGTLNNPNASAFTYGFFAVTSAGVAVGHARRAVRLLFLLATLTLTGFVILTQSNTGILATVLSLALVLLLQARKRHYVIGGIGIAGLAALFLAYSIGILDRPMDSGLSERFPIWQTVIEQIEQAPLVGNGYQKQLFPDAQGEPGTASYAHSALLASARDGGLVAIVLHLLILGTALATALRYFRQHNDPVYLAYLLFGFLCMLVDTDQLITRPRELWVIFWWPLAVLVALRLRPPSTQPAQETRREQRAS